MKSSAGKGNDPIKGYNYKNWYSNYDSIFRKKNVIGEKITDLSKSRNNFNKHSQQ